jgi:hypothetical protein
LELPSLQQPSYDDALVLLMKQPSYGDALVLLI